MPDATRLKTRIAEMGLTQTKIADELGLSQPALSQKINGQRPFFLPEAEKLAKILHIEDCEFRGYFFCSENCTMQNTETQERKMLIL